jgi:CubicO group peptidase (beta-lactamase class C family)
LLFQPGTQWSYSSPGIEILGRIIEVVSGQKYEDFVADRILRPLGMKDSFFYPPADKVARIAMVYVHKDGKLVVLSQ